MLSESYLFNASERVFLSLLPLYLNWFTQQWPDFDLHSNVAKELVIYCLKSIQGTHDAGQQWHKLLSGCLFELHDVNCSCDHEVFILVMASKTCYIALATDDMLFIQKTRAPFLALKAALDKLFDLASCEGSILKFLNLWIIQSPSGVSFDQTTHIYKTLSSPNILRIISLVSRHNSNLFLLKHLLRSFSMKYHR